MAQSTHQFTRLVSLAAALIAIIVSCNRQGPASPQPTPGAARATSPSPSGGVERTVSQAQGSSAPNSSPIQAKDESHPLQVSSVADLLSSHLAAGTLVEVEGIVTDVYKCEYLPEARDRCVQAHFSIADDRYAAPSKRLTVALPDPDTDRQLNVKVGDHYKVRGTIAKQLGSMVQSNENHPLLAYIQHVTTALPPRAANESTYMDGSWSVDDLFLRPDLKPGMSIRVTAYVVDVYQCPPCPKPLVCKPCSPDVVTLGDTPERDGNSLVVSGFPSEGRRLVLPKRGTRCLFTGTFEESIGGVFPSSGGGMRYQSYKRVSAPVPRKR